MSSQVVDEIVAAVKRVISATLTFLQRLSDMQVKKTNNAHTNHSIRIKINFEHIFLTISWSVNVYTFFFLFLQASIWSMRDGGAGEDDDIIAVGTVPPVPNLHHVTGMLVHVEHVHQCTLTLTHLTTQLSCEEPREVNSGLEKLSISNSQVALRCNELAASLLTVIKSTPCTTGKELSSQVQSLSHEIARAGKNLNHLLKKRGVSSRRSSRTPQPQILQSNVPTKSIKTVPTVADNGSGSVSLTVAQVGPDLDEKTTMSASRQNNVLHEVESRNNGTDSTLTISTVEHRSKADTTPATSADTTNMERDTSSENSSEPSESIAKSSNCNPTTNNMGAIDISDVIVAEGTPVKTIEETVNVRHSNATGQVISESPTHSPPHHTTSSCTTSNGFSATAIASVPGAAAMATVAAASDEEDSSVI